MLLSADVELLSPPIAPIRAFARSAEFAGPAPAVVAPPVVVPLSSGPPAPTAIVPAFGTPGDGSGAPSRPASLVAWDDAGNSLWATNRGDPGHRPTSTGSAPEGFAPAPFDGPPSPADLAAMPKAPWSPTYSYIGSINDFDLTAIRVPVGPTTRTLILGVKTGPAGGPAPRIDQLFLLDSGGGLLSSISGASILGPRGEQLLYISLRGAPVGAEVVVGLATTGGQATYPLEGGGAIGPAVAGGVDDGADSPWGDGSYFQLSVQRNDAGGQGVAAPAAASADDGDSHIVALSRTDASTTMDRMSSSTEARTTVSLNGSAPRGPVASAAVRLINKIDAEPAADEPVEVFMGPLVSRTASALGPVLATINDDPTPASDRDAGARIDATTAFGADLDLDALLAVKARAGSDADVPADAAVTTLRGPGGVPIVVAGLHAGDDATGFAEDLASSALNAAGDAPPPPLDAPPPTAGDGRDEVVRAGLATRALGFLVGMCLASGPLYPDLVALARRKLRRKFRRRKGRPLTLGRG